MTFRILPLGVGDAFTAHHYSTCLALQAEGTTVLVDCPHPIQKMMREAAIAAEISLAPADVSAVFLTHLHADHCCGLEGLAFYTFFYLRRRLPLYLHDDVRAHLWDGHLAAGMKHLTGPDGAEREMKLEDYFELHSLREGESVQAGPFAVECRKTIHHVPTTALRVRAAGRTVGHSADTAWDPGLIEWLGSADLVVHETNYGIHTPYEKLAALPAALRAKMRLVHYPDDFDLEASVIEPLRQGQLVEV